MFGVLQRRLEWERGDQQERLMLSIDKMFGREQNNALEELFDFWREKRQHGNIPRVHGFQYKTSLSTDALRHVSWADVTATDPYNFVTREHRKQTAFRDHSNCRLGEYPSRMNLRALAAEYIDCIQTRKPIYHEIDQTMLMVTTLAGSRANQRKCKLSKYSRIFSATQIIRLILGFRNRSQDKGDSQLTFPITPR